MGSGASSIRTEQRYPRVPYGSASGVRFIDCYRSVNCDTTDQICCAVANFPCTMMSQQVFHASDTSSCTFTVVNDVDSLMGFGLLDDQPSRPASLILGDVDLENSIGLVSTGQAAAIWYKDNAFDGPYPAFEKLDKICVSLSRGTFRVQRNGRDVSSKLHGLTFRGDFRFGVTLSTRGQCVCVGDVTPRVLPYYVLELARTAK